MSSTRGRGGRNRGRGGSHGGSSETTRPANNAALIKTVCDATSWPKDDVEKALIENEWNPDSTVEAILAGVYGKPTEEWHQVGVKPKKKAPQPTGSTGERPKRSGTPITQKETDAGTTGFLPSLAGEKRGKGPRDGNRSGTPKKAPAPTAAPTNAPKAPTAEASQTQTQTPAPTPAPPTANKWAAGAPSFQTKKVEPPVEVKAPKQEEVVKPEEPVAKQPEPKVEAPEPEPEEPTPAPAAPAPAPVKEKVEPKAATNVEAPVEAPRAKAPEAKLGSKIELSELMSHGPPEYPPEMMQPMMMPPGAPPEMAPYMFYNPMFHYNPQEGADGKDGEAGQGHPQQPTPYMHYPFYPPYYPPYGMGQFGGSPQYFPPSVYKAGENIPNASPAFHPQGPQGFSEDGQQAAPMFYPPFPLYAPPPVTGAEEGQDFPFNHQHPAIPPMMMPPMNRVNFPGPFGPHGQAPHSPQPGQPGQRNNTRQ